MDTTQEFRGDSTDEILQNYSIHHADDRAVINVSPNFPDEFLQNGEPTAQSNDIEMTPPDVLNNDTVQQSYLYLEGSFTKLSEVSVSSEIISVADNEQTKDDDSPLLSDSAEIALVDATTIHQSDVESSFDNVPKVLTNTGDILDLLTLKNMPGADFKVVQVQLLYSEKLNKTFVPMEHRITFKVSQEGWTSIPTTIRIMMVFSDPAYRNDPVVRCDNHRCNDTSNRKEVEHFLRCENSEAVYVGKIKDRSYKERLAVMVPMGYSREKSIVLKCMCLSTCRSIGRRATWLLFAREDQYGCVLGYSLFPMKVCAQIKRDMHNEEELLEGKSDHKRQKIASMAPKRGKKVARPSTSRAIQQSLEPREEESAWIGMNVPQHMAGYMLEHGIHMLRHCYKQSSNETERNQLLRTIEELQRRNPTLGSPNNQTSN